MHWKIRIECSIHARNLTPNGGLVIKLCRALLLSGLEPSCEGLLFGLTPSETPSHRLVSLYLFSSPPQRYTSFFIYNCNLHRPRRPPKGNRNSREMKSDSCGMREWRTPKDIKTKPEGANRGAHCL